MAINFYFYQNLYFNEQSNYLKKTTLSYFLVWLIMVNHILIKHPNLFEFNEFLLDILMNHIHSGHYFPLAHPTYSDRQFRRNGNIFDEILNKKSLFINKNYIKNNFIDVVLKDAFLGCLKVDQQDYLKSQNFASFCQFWRMKRIKITQLTDFYFEIDGNKLIIIYKGTSTNSSISDNNAEINDIVGKIITI
ncbi:hypothetical protein HZS_4559 [Henneguya salminicola]|nr:hypothetical protein HZS_4559 [Henneguya salminicola]